MSKQTHQHENGDDEKKSSSKIKSVGLWIVSPYLFSKKDMSPLGDLSVPTPKKRKRRSFDNMEEVLKDNPDFEKQRVAAMRVLRIRMTFLAACLAGWFYVAFIGVFSSIFPFEIMDIIFKTIYTTAFVLYLWVSDFQYISFKHRLIKPTIVQYMRCRLGF